MAFVRDIRVLAQGFASFGILVILVNGIFQEEALFAPPALGLLTCLTGLIIGNAARARSGSRTVAAPADQG